MLGVRLPFKWGKKKKDKGLIRLGVNPVRIYKIVHPKECEEDVMALCGVGSNGSYVLNRYPVLKWIQKTIRAGLRLKKPLTPSEELVKKYFFMQPNQTEKAVAVVALGSKADMLNADGIEML